MKEKESYIGETKILNLYPKKDDGSVEILEALLEMAKKGDLKNVIISGTNAEGEIITSTINASVLEVQTLIGILQLNNYKRGILEDL